MRKKKLMMLVALMIVLIIMIYRYYNDDTKAYYKDIILSDRVRITNLQTYKSAEVNMSTIKDQDISISFSMLRSHEEGVKFEDNPLYRIEFFKNDNISQTIYFASAKGFEMGGNHPEMLDGQNPFIFDYKGNQYMCYSAKYILNFSDSFYQYLLEAL